jgi:hypothetical protein
MAQPQQELFNTLIKKIAEVLVQEISNEEKAKGWTFAFVDIRSPADDPETRVGKLRIAFKGAAASTLLDSSVQRPPYEVKDLFRELWPTRPSFEKMWYGLKVTVFPDGKYNVEFNYDPECSCDPKFFESQTATVFART